MAKVVIACELMACMPGWARILAALGESGQETRDRDTRYPMLIVAGICKYPANFA
jgi:hypothetical protein